MTSFTMWIPPAQYPTWHERAYDPGTPEAMYHLLDNEALALRTGTGIHGEFGHTYWAEQHPYYTTKMKGYVWLPGIQMYEVPGDIRRNCALDYRDGKVFLCAVVDENMVPSWV